MRPDADEDYIDIATPGLRMRFLALIWGFAEANLFFLAPSILISYVALRHGVFQGLFIGVFVTGAATMGGLVLYMAAGYQYAEIQAVLLQVPGVTADGIRAARADLKSIDALAVLAAAYNSFTPYKVFALEAKAAGVPAFTFVLASFFHYMSRAFLAALVAGAAGMVLKFFLPRRVLILIWAGVWVVAYGLYFGRFYL